MLAWGGVTASVDVTFLDVELVVDSCRGGGLDVPRRGLGLWAKATTTGRSTWQEHQVQSGRHARPFSATGASFWVTYFLYAAPHSAYPPCITSHNGYDKHGLHETTDKRLI